jgi:hypothetical protein
VVFGRKAVKSGTSAARVVLNHSLDSLFEGKHMTLKHKPKKKKKDDTSEEENSSDEDIELDEEGCHDIVRPVVIFSDPQEFIAKVMLDRNIDPEKTVIKIGADDGQGLFKLNVQLLSREVETGNNGRAKYSDVSRYIYTGLPIFFHDFLCPSKNIFLEIPGPSMSVPIFWGLHK